MGIKTGLQRSGQVIDWIFRALSGSVVVGAFVAMQYVGDDAKKIGAALLVVAIVLFLVGRAARYIIDGFAEDA